MEDMTNNRTPKHNHAISDEECDQHSWFISVPLWVQVQKTIPGGNHAPVINTKTDIKVPTYVFRWLM